VLAFSRVDLLTGLNETCMKGLSSFAMKFFFLFLLGTIFGKVMEDSAQLSRHLFPGIHFFGAATFVMAMLPGPPQIQNIIPTKYLGTTAMAAPALGLIASFFVITANTLLLGWMVRHSKSRGESHPDSDPMAAAAASTPKRDDKPLPSIWLAFTPPVLATVLY
jgi:H+/gluconate symporter-like permease